MTTATFEPRHSIRLKPGRDASVRARHPWIFSGAVAEVASLPDAQDGDVCDVRSDAGEWLARGTLHRSSQILCRILTWREEPIDTAFFLGRFAEAARLRAEMADLEGTDAFRVVNAEGDRLPGLIVDRYGEHLVVQALTTGMLRLQPAWLAALEESFAPASVVDRTEGAVRDPAMYGRRAVLSGDPPPDGMLSIREAGIRFRVSLLSGQKTGFYLDQRPNRLRLGQLARGREVLNLSLIHIS
ncbi:MAG: 23S rRNA (cytosine(1962)-C(5))-methyltransferase RlmI, partial [Candidatus Eisenbacteria bacterium]|nr:23S rRNA (cytosine(1962)-C(5))-methyltransferase RlmI [Candidatus Eisenbacteria bacterium]